MHGIGGSDSVSVTLAVLQRQRLRREDDVFLDSEN
jgi:hypothetical protein